MADRRTIFQITKIFFSDEYGFNIDFTNGENTAIDGQTDGQSCAATLNGEMFVIGGKQQKTQVHI